MARRAKNTINLFEQASSVNKPTKKENKKKEKESVGIVGLVDYAQVDAAIKTLETLKKTLLENIKPQIIEHIAEEGMKLGARPENFEGVETKDNVKAKASCELRRRSVSSPLSDAEIDLLNDYKIPYDNVESAPACYIFNPKYMNDSALLEKVSKQLVKIPDLPDDLIQRMDSKNKNVVSDESLTKVFQLDDLEKVMEILDTVGVFAVKAKLENTKVAVALRNLAKLVDGDANS